MRLKGVLWPELDRLARERHRLRPDPIVQLAAPENKGHHRSLRVWGHLPSFSACEPNGSRARQSAPIKGLAAHNISNRAYQQIELSPDHRTFDADGQILLTFYLYSSRALPSPR
jgi:hypothetical protein